MNDICIEIDTEVLEFMYKFQRTALLDMVRHAWLSPAVLKDLFEVARADGGMLLYITKLCLSNPNAEVRAAATAEILAFVPVEQLGRHLWF